MRVSTARFAGLGTGFIGINQLEVVRCGESPSFLLVSIAYVVAGVATL